MDELWRMVAKTFGARTYALFLAMFSLMLTARWLGPEGRGVVAAVTTWVGLFSTFGYLSLGQVAIRQATERRREEWLGPMFGSLGFLAVIITLTGWGVAATLYAGSGGAVFGHLPVAVLLVGFLLLPFNIWEQYGSSLLMALDRIDINNRNQIIGGTIGLAALFVMVWGLQWGVAGAILAILAGQMVISTGGIHFLTRRSRGSIAVVKSEIRSLLSGGVRLHLNAIGTFLFTASDILMLNHYRGAEETGYYQLAAQLVLGLMILPQAASMVLYGKVTRLGPDEAWPYQKRLLGQILGLMILIALLAGATAPWFIVWFAGKAFAPAVPIFQWFLLILIGTTFSTMMASQWIGRGYFMSASLISLSVGIGNVAANAVLIPRYGMFGAVWASIGTYSFAVLANMLMVIHCDKSRHRTAAMAGIVE